MMEFDKRKTVAYLIWTFAFAWIAQIAACILALQGQAGLYQFLLLVAMYAPFAAVLLSRKTLKGLGWIPKLKKRVRYYLLAWFGPGILGVLGAALFFLVFPRTFDPELGMLVEQMGEEGTAVIWSLGMTAGNHLLISALSAVVIAPILNMFAAIGEETGWRGMLYPQLKMRFGNAKGSVLGGVIWGVWHFPLIMIIGYEYGTDYLGAPVLGPVVFCLFTISAGILLDWLYLRTECIWVPALAHGAINAFGSVPIYFLRADSIQMNIFGPAYIGAVAMIPVLALAGIALWRVKPVSARRECEETNQNMT